MRQQPYPIELSALTSAPPKVAARSEVVAALRRALLVLALVGAGAFAILHEVPLCPSATLFGVPCPGCGLTRASLALLRGDWRGALGFHPLVFLLLPLTGVLLASGIWSYVAGPKHPPPSLRLSGRFAAPAAWALLALVLVVWVARFFGAFGGPAPVHALGPLVIERAVALVRR